MYAIGQTVLYGANGVCSISEITTRKIGKEAIEYYVLKPMGMQASTVYVPRCARSVPQRRCVLCWRQTAA